MASLDRRSLLFHIFESGPFLAIQERLMKVLFVALAIVGATIGVASAEPGLEEPYAPFKLVGLMPDTGQVLLWADLNAEYRVAKVGDDLDGWKVTQIDPKSL